MQSRELTLFFVWCVLRITAKKQKLAAYHKRYYSHPEIRAKKLAQSACRQGSLGRIKYMREYYVANREEKRRNALKPENKARRQSARKLRFEKNPVARLLHNYRMRVYHAVVGAKKLSRSLLLVGCSIGQLKKYLEDRFSPGMSWENYGEWHVDHVKPCASFDFVDPEQQKKCFHFSNLQPLWASDNLRKGRAYGR